MLYQVSAILGNIQEPQCKDNLSISLRQNFFIFE